MSSINFHRGRYGVPCGGQDKIEFRPTYARCMRECLIGSGGRCLCCSLPGGAGQYSRIHGGYRISERATNTRPGGRSRRETSPKNLPRFSALCRLVLPHPRAPAGHRSSFVRPRSRSPRFLFLSLSRRTYSLHPGRCTRGVAYLYRAPRRSALGMILRFRKTRNKIILAISARLSVQISYNMRSYLNIIRHFSRLK